MEKKQVTNGKLNYSISKGKPLKSSNIQFDFEPQPTTDGLIVSMPLFSINSTFSFFVKDHKKNIVSITLRNVDTKEVTFKRDFIYSYGDRYHVSINIDGKNTKADITELEIKRPRWEWLFICLPEKLALEAMEKIYWARNLQSRTLESKCLKKNTLIDCIILMGKWDLVNKKFNRLW